MNKIKEIMERLGPEKIGLILGVVSGLLAAKIVVDNTEVPTEEQDVEQD